MDEKQVLLKGPLRACERINGLSFSSFCVHKHPVWSSTEHSPSPNDSVFSFVSLLWQSLSSFSRSGRTRLLSTEGLFDYVRCSGQQNLLVEKFLLWRWFPPANQWADGLVWGSCLRWLYQRPAGLGVWYAEIHYLKSLMKLFMSGHPFSRSVSTMSKVKNCDYHIYALFNVHRQDTCLKWTCKNHVDLQESKSIIQEPNTSWR